MRGFMDVLQHKCDNLNRVDMLLDPRPEPMVPARIDVVMSLYLDTTGTDFDRVQSDTVLLIVLDDMGQNADLVFDFASHIWDEAHNGDRGVELVRSEMSKSRQAKAIELVIGARHPFLILTQEQSYLGVQLPRLATRVSFAQVDQRLVDRVADHFWPDDKARVIIKDWEPNVTDLLVASRTAKTRASFYQSIATYQEEALPEEKPATHVPKVLALSAMYGFGEAFDWGMQLAEDLADYRAGKRAWADMDVGVLLTSPPGGGKTTFARALAAECDCPFFPTSYTDWAGGKEASGDTISKKLVQLFAEWRRAAKESGCCIVFIDEIDSIGKRGLDWRQDYWFGPVINSWLAFLDGAVPRDGIVVIAATNYPDRVDDAMRRPGRLDRHIRIPLPDMLAIEGIVDYHLGSVEDDVVPVARALRGKSPAEIMQACKDARRHARTMDRPALAADVLRFLPSRREDSDEDRLVCVHEAGHAIACLEVGYELEDVDVDVGVTHSVQPETSRTEMYRKRLHVAFGGRAAEEVVIGAIGVGCGSDLRHATQMAQAWLFQMGHGGLTYFAPGAALTTPQVAVVEAWLQEGYAESLAIIRRREHQVRKLADALRTRRFMTCEEIVALVTFDRLRFRRSVEAGYDALDRYWGEQQSLDPRQTAD